MTNSASLTERSYRAPLILVITLFFLWALGVNLIPSETGLLIPSVYISHVDALQ